MSTSSMTTCSRSSRYRLINGRPSRADNLPVDMLDVVPGTVFAHILKFNAAAPKHRPVLACHQRVDRSAAADMDPLDFFL